MNRILILMIAGCSHEPTCVEIADHVSQIGRDADTKSRGVAWPVGDGPFSSFGQGYIDYGREIGARCERGELDHELARCLLAAKHMLAIDRCSIRAGER